MSPRLRWLVAIVGAAVIWAALTWLDRTVLLQAQRDASANFNSSSYLWLAAFGSLAVAAGMIVIAGLAWWTRSAVVGIVFLIAGLAETFAVALGFSNMGLPNDIAQTALSWAEGTRGPLSASHFVGAALVVAGIVGIARWALTRRLALKDA